MKAKSYEDGKILMWKKKLSRGVFTNIPYSVNLYKIAWP